MVRHPEKIARKDIALKVRGGMSYKDIEADVVALRHKIRSEVAQFVKLAEETYLAKHPGFVP